MLQSMQNGRQYLAVLHSHRRGYSEPALLDYPRCLFSHSLSLSLSCSISLNAFNISQTLYGLQGGNSVSSAARRQICFKAHTTFLEFPQIIVLGSGTIGGHFVDLTNEESMAHLRNLSLTPSHVIQGNILQT